MAELARVIEEYYRRVDRADLDWVTALFSPGAVYMRADARYEGAETIAGFFREQRRIRGIHTVDLMVADEARRLISPLGLG